MPRVAIRFTRSRRALVNAPVVKKELAATMEESVKPHYIKEFEKRVSNWRGKPGFAARKVITTDYIALDVYPTGLYANRWIWTSRGTKRHEIAVRYAPLLVFRLGYNAKTQPIDQYNVGNGKATGAQRTALRVMHPGTKARRFEESINKKEQNWYKKTIENAFRRGIRAMQKG